MVGSVETLFKFVNGSNPHWSDYKKRIAVALLAIYKMKPAQCALTDHLKLLWIFLGDHFLRAHDGHCFFYETELGALTTFHGVLPYSHFMYMRQICLHLEGLCREFPSGVERSDAGVMAAIETVFNRTSQRGKGGKGLNAGKGKGPETSDDGEAAAASNGQSATFPSEPLIPQPDAENTLGVEASGDEEFIDDYAFDADDEKLFAELLDNALFNKGNELLRRGGSHGKGWNNPKGGGKDWNKGDRGGKDFAKGFYQPAAVEDDVANDDVDENVVTAPAVWNIGLAQAISRCSTSLQAELMGNKLLK